MVVVEGWAGDRCWEREGWRDEVRAGRLLLLSEDLEPLLRNGGWGGVSRPTGHRRGRRAGRGGWDEGEWDGDGLFGEHHGVPLIGGPTTATVRTTASEEAVARALPVA